MLLIKLSFIKFQEILQSGVVSVPGYAFHSLDLNGNVKRTISTLNGNWPIYEFTTQVTEADYLTFMESRPGIDPTKLFKMDDIGDGCSFGDVNVSVTTPTVNVEAPIVNVSCTCCNDNDDDHHDHDD